MNATWTWKDAPDLMADLVRTQNHPANIGQDIMTFAGFCDSRDELEAHLCRYRMRAENYDAAKEYA